MPEKGQQKDIQNTHTRKNETDLDAFVLEKTIFSNVFEKDIKRVYIYKKAERLAKAIHLIAPAFAKSGALAERMDRIAVALVDAATLPPSLIREGLSRELLTLSSVLAIAHTSGLLSSMNAELISREAHTLLAEIAAYEEPRISLAEVPTLAELFRSVNQPREESCMPRAISTPMRPERATLKDTKGHVSDNASSSSRRDAILAVLKAKGPSYIKDISTVVRDVSEKTIQRELSALVAEGVIDKAGERRWTRYTLHS
jgi:DNA-binding transcriptional ArsR family regulator